MSNPNTFTFQSGYIQIFEPPKSISKKQLYIPIWLYSNEIREKAFLINLILYIPIWLYSNTHLGGMWTKMDNFTFQSGYIQMINSSTVQVSESNCFTFQSGYIQMAQKKTGLLPWGYFTFQSGYIQIMKRS